MKIISGNFRGTRITAPKGLRLRPTANLVREAVFNVAGPFVESGLILDLFAGSGAFGFEGLSRDASEVVFVDVSRTACSHLKRVGEQLGVQKRMAILNMNAMKAVKMLATREKKFSLVFLDPPYYSNDIDQIFGMKEFAQLLSDNGLVVCETSSRSKIEVLPPDMHDFFSRKYGETMVNMFRVHPGLIEETV